MIYHPAGSGSMTRSLLVVLWTLSSLYQLSDSSFALGPLRESQLRPEPGNGRPDSRQYDSIIIDANGTRWKAFGSLGRTTLSDLWSVQPSSGSFIWKLESGIPNSGIQSVIDVNHVEPLYQADGCADAAGNLWFFGGFSVPRTSWNASAGVARLSSALWNFNVRTRLWRRYDNQTSLGDWPQPRRLSLFLCDRTRDTLFLYGGSNPLGPPYVLSDVWEFSIRNLTWRRYQVPPGEPSPMGRFGPPGWIDPGRGFWMNGGQVTKSLTDAFDLFLADLWYFSVANESWTHLSGPLTPDIAFPGQYSSNALPFPPGRAYASTSQTSGHLWLTGGVYDDGSATPRLYDDWWVFDKSLSLWIQIAGDLTQCTVYTLSNDTWVGHRNSLLSLESLPFNQSQIRTSVLSGRSSRQGNCTAQSNGGSFFFSNAEARIICIGPKPPGVNVTCDQYDLRWRVWDSVVQTGNATLETRTLINGTLVINTGSTLTLSGAITLNSSKCITIQPGSSLYLTGLPALQSLTSGNTVSSTLLFSDDSCITGNFSNIFSDPANGTDCAKIVAEQQVSPRSLSVVFRYDDTDCTKPSLTAVGGWVVPVAITFGLVGAIVLALGIGCAIPSVRVRMFPFLIRPSVRMTRMAPQLVK